MPPEQPTPGQAPSNQGTQSSPTNDGNPFAPSPTVNAPSTGTASPASDSRSHGGAVAPADAPQPVNAPGGLAAQQSREPSQTSGSAAPANGLPTPPVPALTAETLKTIVESTVRGVLPQQQPQQQVDKPMSADEFNAHYQLPKIDAATYEAIIGTGPDKPERVAALQNVLMGHTRSAVLMAKSLFDSQLAALRSEINPIFAAHQAQREASIANEFYTAYPEFKDEQALINEIKDAHIARKTQFASKQEAFNAVATQARQIMSRFKAPSGTPAAAPQAGTQSQPNVQPLTRTMTPSSQGGRGGTGAATSKSTAEQIFG